MKWLEIAVYTTDEGMDTVAAALNGVGISGLSMEESQEAAAAFLLESVPYWDYADMDKIGSKHPCVKGYVSDCEENYPLIEAAKKAVEALRDMELGLSLGSLLTTVTTMDEEDWANNWKQYYKPMEIGNRLLVLPNWEPVPQTERVILRLDPGMAFGSGGHHTTRMCLELLERVLVPGQRMLDMGCGSGILSIAAGLLGAKKAVAVDIDPIAEKVALENAQINGLDADSYSVRIGNLINDDSLVASLGGEYELVCANIVADVIIALKDIAKSLCAKGGYFIVSGIIDDREAEVETALKAAGFKVLEVKSSDCWYALLCQNPQ